MAKRRKAAAIDAPQTLEEAADLARRYAHLDNLMALRRAYAADRIAEIERATAAIEGRCDEEQKVIFRKLGAWWAANKVEMTKGKRRSIELAGVSLGERKTPPSLKLPKGVPAAEMIAKLFAAKRGELVTTKYFLDRPAIIKLLGQPKEAKPLTALGLGLSTKDEFFISTGSAEQPVDMDEADPAGG